MLTIEVFAEGVTPLLLHRATEEDLLGEVRTNTVAERKDPRIVCEQHIYRLPNRQIAIPGAAFARMAREAGGSHKAKGSRKSLKYIVPAAMIVLDDLCGLYLKDRKTPITDFEIDSRPVTIPSTKGRVMRHRARLNEWSVKVHFQLNDSIIAESMLRQLWADGLQQIGVGDFRPERGGPFGTSSVVAWKIISEPKPKNVSQLRNTA